MHGSWQPEGDKRLMKLWNIARRLSLIYDHGTIAVIVPASLRVKYTYLFKLAFAGARRATPSLRQGSCRACGLAFLGWSPGCAQKGNVPLLPTSLPLAVTARSLFHREDGNTPRLSLRPQPLGPCYLLASDPSA